VSLDGAELVLEADFEAVGSRRLETLLLESRKLAISKERASRVDEEVDFWMDGGGAAVTDTVENGTGEESELLPGDDKDDGVVWLEVVDVEEDEEGAEYGDIGEGGATNVVVEAAVVTVT